MIDQSIFDRCDSLFRPIQEDCTCQLKYSARKSKQYLLSKSSLLSVSFGTIRGTANMVIDELIKAAVLRPKTFTRI